MQWQQGAYTVSDDFERLDFDVIHGFLSQVYWSRGIPRETVERAARGSLAFGVYDQGAQVGFARVITDRATFAYLADVFVVESHRGRGLSKFLVGSILAHPDLQGLRRWMLVTADAHGLYSQFGFQVAAQPEKYMEITRPGMYEQQD